MGVQAVWFKRDLRIADHAPLAEAAARGPVLPLYIVEPGLWAEPDAAGRHWTFLHEGLEELRAALAALGAPLAVRLGEALPVLRAIDARHGLDGLWSHQETGNAWTHARDRAVRAWCREAGVPWIERPQSGVIRGLARRDGWARKWDRFMARPIVPTPPALTSLPGIDPGPLPDLRDLGLADDPCPGRQAGGRRAGVTLLESFLAGRGAGYHRAMSSPITAFDGCSRLSAHLAAGTLSIREVAQATRARLDGLEDASHDERRRWRPALSAFIGRLHWHCHFIQKLEDAPEHEHRNVHPGYDGLREDGADPTLLQAWSRGETGLPMVDACMRALRATGWINFRMRAMLMAVAAYHLWQHWREPGLHLARLFTDYEPGIHWNQCQMQSGTTGINTVRIYNPVKQSRDQDPEGRFIRRWLPELSGVPDAGIHEPWRLDRAAQARAGCRIGTDYPAPVVDHAAAARAAREAIHAVRRDPAFRETADAIQARHGSRRSGLPPSNPRRRRDPAQLGLKL